ncbi:MULTISPECIES: hypothetical protein [unclassified Leptolyngbya]|uniref:hypothetical protein n=1 Tax=unclassified Leptolyngbya TaxID=2650499 RepID=UPI001685E63D|nr:MULTISPECIES: hypothetical protein [unclassified Leptolyngbya]MBD1909903.1 hypothetical protein [Leptolyngbya sp. FACHB-8]MBD2158633.1 hypothetical protein [Leptolyngbya sp. FACHB-16]
MSIGNTTLRQSLWKSQPYKGILFIGLIAVISLLFELLLGQIFQLDTTSKLIYITIFFVWWWHLGFSLNGYPGDRFSTTRLGRGTINLVILLVLSYLTGEAWKYIAGTPILADTQVGQWGQTAIVTAAASLFFFDNTIVTSDRTRHWDPVSGFLNIFLAVFFIAPALTFLPQLWGLDPFYIPWYWYPTSTVFGSFFERWPLNNLSFKQPQLGFVHTGAVLLLTLIMALVLKKIGIDLFTTTTGPTFAAIWTTVGLGLLWQFNLWPFTQLVQPAKGIITSLASLFISIAFYVLTLSIFGEANIIEGLYWWFNILWVQVFLMAPGLYDGIGLWQERRS